MLYIGADHGGFKLKEHLKAWLQVSGARLKDFGAYTLDMDDDYPDFAKKVAKKVAAAPSQDFGILLCRSGQGVCMVANKCRGVRASLVWNVKEAKASRSDDHANVLCLPADYLSQAQTRAIVRAWLDTPWSKDKRHVRRVKKISALEK